ncbi:MAG: 23S rRNA (cytosine(1962)-C(5))-methyltransferase RlmI, partial [Burkholderiaceae bacterium]|nr:23S rRNA (cytosine(1962)-C(5))-methyltransferase RlmI [Burkholderiaceae bacterium]
MSRTEPALVLKPGKEKSLLRRHPWIYATAVAQVAGRPEPGDAVRVLGADGRFLARAAYSPASAIRARAWTFDEAEPVDAALIASRVAAAVARRDALRDESDALRLVFGEADALPGCVVDRYADQLVVQCLAAGVERWRDTIVAARVGATGCAGVYERSDAAARAREGRAPREGPRRGAGPAPGSVVEDGVRD